MLGVIGGQPAHSVSISCFIIPAHSHEAVHCAYLTFPIDFGVCWGKGVQHE